MHPVMNHGDPVCKSWTHPSMGREGLLPALWGCRASRVPAPACLPAKRKHKHLPSATLQNERLLASVCCVLLQLVRHLPMFGFVSTAVCMVERVEATVSKVVLRIVGTLAGGEGGSGSGPAGRGAQSQSAAVACHLGLDPHQLTTAA